MTEAEWLESATRHELSESTDLHEMLIWLRSNRNPTSRKLRLFAVACCRRIWNMLTDPRSQNAVAVAEQWADGATDEDDLRFSWEGAVEVIDDSITSIVNPYASRAAVAAASGRDTEQEPDVHAAHHAADYANCALTWGLPGGSGSSYLTGVNSHTEMADQVRILHELFGNPFRPVVLDSNWRTSTVVSVAQGIYDDRAFDRMPILADALEDAGCEQQDILNHCRSDGPHVRGCWVVDLLLGKE